MDSFSTEWTCPPNRVNSKVRGDPALALLDLHNVAVRGRLALAPAVAHELRCWGFTQLDRGALLAPQRALTQAVTGAVLRGEIISSVDGLFAESRHDDDLIAVFIGGQHAPQLTVVNIEPLTPTQATVVVVASELDLAP